MGFTNGLKSKSHLCDELHNEEMKNDNVAPHFDAEEYNRQRYVLYTIEKAVKLAILSIVFLIIIILVGIYIYHLASGMFQRNTSLPSIKDTVDDTFSIKDSEIDPTALDIILKPIKRMYFEIKKFIAIVAQKKP